MHVVFRLVTAEEGISRMLSWQRCWGTKTEIFRGCFAVVSSEPIFLFEGMERGGG